VEIPIALLIGIAVFVLAFYVTIDDRRVIGFCIEGGCVVEERMVGRALWISGSAASIAIGTTIIAMRIVFYFRRSRATAESEAVL